LDRRRRCGPRCSPRPRRTRGPGPGRGQRPGRRSPLRRLEARAGRSTPGRDGTSRELARGAAIGSRRPWRGGHHGAGPPADHPGTGPCRDLRAGAPPLARGGANAIGGSPREEMPAGDC
jgi:hypothetical protein